MTQPTSPLATTVEMPRKRRRVFSGIQPTGDLHIGNYLGAVRTWRAQVEEGVEETFFCIVDAHAVTVDYQPKELQKKIDAFATDLVACGLDPSKTTLFVQSDVHEHAELAWYLAAVTGYGELQRMTQFKDKGEGRDFVSAALFTYPVLMAADILLYKAHVVPVGEDQLQHLELARDVARRFNHRFGEIFPEPQPRLSATPRIMGVDGLTKMSKSKNNAIGLFEPSNELWSKLRTAYTDPQRLKKSDPGRPEVCNIYTMHRALSSKETQDEVVASCTGAKWGCVDCKKVLYENFEKELVQLRTKREALTMKDVRDALAEGADKARAVARETVAEVKDLMGVGSRAKP